jgi:hypothetical protein
MPSDFARYISLSGTQENVYAGSHRIKRISWETFEEDGQKNIRGTVMFDEISSYNNVSTDFPPLTIHGRMTLYGVEVLGEDGFHISNRDKVEKGKEYPITIRAVARTTP